MTRRYIHTEEIHNFNAPREVVPLVMELVRPKSVLDVGCGTGTWLKVFEEHGIVDYLGVDGNYIDMDQLKVLPSHYKPHDLSQELYLNRKFDLVLSLEVAEHLPEASSDLFVKTLVNHGEIILFSAAIPGQGGQNHLNEQWPIYWQKKFAIHGYYFHDSIRPAIWNNETIEWWYRQSIFLVTRGTPDNSSNEMISMLHPGLLDQIMRKNLHYIDSVKKGEQGLILSIKIFYNSILFKLRSMLGLR